MRRWLGAGTWWRALAVAGAGLELGCASPLDGTEDVGSTTQYLCSGTVLSGNPVGPVSAGASVTLTAKNASCAVGETAEYKFVFERENTSDGYTTLRGYGPSATTTWDTTGLPGGKYQLIVYTRAAGNTSPFQHAGYLNYYINNVCLSGSLGVSPSSPQTVGTSVTLAATATCTAGATPEFRYMYRRPDQTTYTEIRPYAGGPATWNTTGLPSGAYNLLVYTRASGNASSSEGVAYANYQLGTVCSGVSLTSSPPSSQLPGTNVTLTGSASCGTSTPEYRFYYRGAADASYALLRGYSSLPSVTWATTGLPGGAYSIMVQARAAGNSSDAEATGYGTYKLAASILSLSAGAGHTCALLDTGVKCFGRQLLGAPAGQYSYDRGLEAGDMGDNLPAVSLGTGRTAKAVATGGYHACAVLDDGNVKCWGANTWGALGLGDTNHRSARAAELGNALPRVDLGQGRRVSAITAGGGYACAILNDGSVKCWGNNTYGSLGLGDTSHRGDAPGEMGDKLPAVNLGSARTAVKIAAGVAHTCAILDDGSLKCWGLNNYGQLGLGDTKSRGDGPNEMGDSLPPVDLGAGRSAVHVALGNYQTCALLDDATLKCWGNGSFGALGTGDSNSRGDGPGEMGRHLPPVDVGACRTVKSVAAGGNHTCAVLDDGSVKCWGYNAEGQLGIGDLSRHGDGPGEMGDSLLPVNLGAGRTALKLVATHVNTCAELDDHRIKCWGAAFTGMLGIGPSERRGDQLSDMGDNLPSFSLGQTRKVQAFGSGFANHYACALLENESVKCWGANSYGQLGIDGSSNVGDEPGDMGGGLKYVPLGASVTSVGAGEYHSCALLSSGAVKCWGANLHGTSGLGDTARHDGRASLLGNNLPAIDLGAGRTATALYVGAEHSCAVLNDGALKCWGENTYGQLGLGDTNDRGDEAGEMGDALPAVNLGSGRTVKAMHLGFRHTCAILDNDALKCWGYNHDAQLGLGDDNDRGDGPGEMGDALPPVSLGSGLTARTVHAGYFNTCVVLDNGGVKCWGDNSHGQLGLGNKVMHGQTPSGMGDGLPAVSLGTARTVTTLGVGMSHVCALLDNTTVKCWGFGAYGKLGYGDTSDRGDGPNELGDVLPAVAFGPGQNVTRLVSGWNHNCVVLAGGGGSMRCWGNGEQGALGLEDDFSRGDDAGEMGSALMSLNLNLGEP